MNDVSYIVDIIFDCVSILWESQNRPATTRLPFVAPFASLIVTYSPTLAGALSLWHTSDAKTRESAVFIATEEAMAKKSLVKASELVEHVIFV